MSRAPVVIVGGGLSGLYAAYLLERQGVRDLHLLEARPRLGGRLVSERAGSAEIPASGARFDLGATWYWPALQPELDGLVTALGLDTIPQYAAGAMLWERSAAAAPLRHVPGYRHAPASVRLAGGMQALVDALSARLTSTRVTLGAKVRRVALQHDQAIAVEFQGAGGPPAVVQADHVLLALPPRLVVDAIGFEPPLQAQIARQWSGCATWMAPHAKYLAVYPAPFWRAEGLSGAARSDAGPLVEIHDASPASGAGALFGIVGVPALARRKVPAETLLQLCRLQMARLFGPQAGQPVADWLQDWSQEEYTATLADATPSAGHGVAPSARSHGDAWSGRLAGIASEWSRGYCGYVAGALDAAARGVEDLLRSPAATAAPEGGVAPRQEPAR